MEPNLRKVSEDQDGTEAAFEISGLPKGMAQTLAVALRRSLIESITGSAITNVRFAGVSSTYGTIPGVPEDTRDIQANLKSARFRLEPGLDEVQVEFTSNGPGPVKISSLDLPDGVKASNPAHLLFHVDPSASSPIKMNIWIRRGSGYVNAEEFRDNEPGDIALDAHFSPVKRCDARATSGDENGEAIEINVRTDGTRTPEECVREASALLQAQAARITGDPDRALAHLPAVPETPVAKAVRPGEPQSLDDLDFSPRIRNTLRRAKITTVPELLAYPPRELMRLRNFGHKSLKDAKVILENSGYADEVAHWEEAILKP